MKNNTFSIFDWAFIYFKYDFSLCKRDCKTRVIEVYSGLNSSHATHDGNTCWDFAICCTLIDLLILIWIDEKRITECQVAPTMQCPFHRGATCVTLINEGNGCN